MPHGEGCLTTAGHKVRVWKREVEQSPRLICLHHGHDLTLPPTDPRGNVPGAATCRILTSSDILSGPHKLVAVPSTVRTALTSAAAAAAVIFLCFARFPPLIQRSSVAPHQNLVSRPSSMLTRIVSIPLALLRSCRRTALLLVRGCAIILVLLWYARYLNRRYPQVRAVSRYRDISTQGSRSRCVVARDVLMMTSSHAGTHADTPSHYLTKSTVNQSFSAVGNTQPPNVPFISPTRTFDYAHYTGDVVVLDISAAVLPPNASEAHAISIELLESALFQLPTPYLHGTKPLWRLILATHTLRSWCAGSEQGSPLPRARPYVTAEAAEYLCKRFPLLLLIGSDASSLTNLVSIAAAEHPHSVFLRHGVAVLENLNCDALFAQSDTASGHEESDGFVEGSLLTVFNPALSFADSRGCSVVFFPLQPVSST